MLLSIYFYLSYFYYHETGKGRNRRLAKPKAERLAGAFGALFSLLHVRSITRGSLFIGGPWASSSTSITPFPFLTNGFKHFTRA
jgi:hypothetical protein